MPCKVGLKSLSFQFPEDSIKPLLKLPNPKIVYMILDIILLVIHMQSIKRNIIKAVFQTVCVSHQGLFLSHGNNRSQFICNK